VALLDQLDLSDVTIVGNSWPAADDAHQVVSPLAMDCKVPFDRRYIFAGLADRMSTFGQARRLWLHWGRPTLAAYPGGHVGFFWSSAAKKLVDGALSDSFPAAEIPTLG